MPRGRSLNEAFGNTTDEFGDVNLSDGGHFENLGLYEMVLRRCHRIVVIDAGRDTDYVFEDLGNAIRKIRIDFGIPIDIVLNSLEPDKQGAPSGAVRRRRDSLRQSGQGSSERKAHLHQAADPEERAGRHP